MKRKNFLYQFMLFFTALSFITNFDANAQKREPLTPAQTKTASITATVISPFTVVAPKKDYNSMVSEATYLQLNTEKLQTAFAKQPREVIFQIPQKNGKPLELLLEKQEILTEDFKVTDQDGVELPYEPGVYYSGRVLNRPATERTSIAALSVVGDEVMAMMNVDGDNFVLGTIRDEQNKKTSDYVLYNDEDLQIPNNFQCGSNMDEHMMGSVSDPSTADMPVAKNIVRVQLEADNQMYKDFGNSISNVSNYLTGLYNMVATIYHNENIVTQIAHIVVWNIADPYPLSAGNSSGDVLNSYRDRKNLVGMTGDLAHLLSTKPLGHGGIAWIDVLCYPTIGYRTAYSNISTSFNNFPLYSWTIDVVTHEMGHNLGSPHTHDCVWGAGGNQAIDNCSSPSGGCPTGPAPLNGGTIMSYCHLTSAGKNFNLGFGSQPGSLIRSKVNAASCLTKAYLSCTSAKPIFCGEPVNGSTVGGVNNVTYYGCNSWIQSGPEKVFVLQTTETSTITASLSNLTADLDVIILDACSESNCLAEGNNTATVPNATAGMYIIVVDGYNGAQGDFTLTVNCSGFCFTTGLTNYEFIDRVQVGTIDNLSGNDYGYADFTGQVTPLHRGGTADVTLTPGFISSPWNEAWRIWIDINHDEDFNDYGELVFDSGAPTSSVVNGVLNVPSFALLGPTRMRVAMKYGSAPDDCGTFSGEVEDYTVDILPYCPSLGITKYEFIDTVEVGSFVNGSGNNMGYADFTGLTTIELLKGETVPLTLTPGFNGTSYPEKWAVWIDYNQDYFFDDTKELVFSTVAGDNGPVSGAFMVAPGAATGETRMRITMYYGSYPTACDYSFWGETEDYTVNITPFCASAANSSYEFIQTVGIGSLLNDSGDDGGYADFTDLPLEATAGAPTGIVLIPGFTSSEYNENWRVWIDFNKNKQFEEEEKIFEGGPSDELVFGAFIIPDSLPEGKYGLRVSMRYGDFPDACGDFSYGEVEDYAITILAGSGGDFTGDLSDRSSDGIIEFESNTVTGDFGLYPNPAKEFVNLNWMNVEAMAGQLVSSSGQTLLTFDEHNVPNRIELNDYPSGLYTLQVITMEKTMITKRFVKVD